jgi:hypothetical protein
LYRSYHFEDVAIGAPDTKAYVQPLGVNPLDATYHIEDLNVTLQDGVSEINIIHSSAKIRTVVFGQPVKGDINNDGIDDMAVMLIHDPGGSGTFYYAAAAIQTTDGNYRGTNAVLLGDRIAPQAITIRNGVLVANFAGRKLEDPMSVMPSVGMTKYMTLTSADNELREISKLQDGGTVLEGYVTTGEKENVLQICDGTSYKLQTNPSQTVLINDARGKNTDEYSDAARPLFAVVAGVVSGTNNNLSFALQDVVQTPKHGGCRSDMIVVDSPYYSEKIVSPVALRGRARGTWFFEASFPIVLVDRDGKTIAQGVAVADADWMTEDFVPFHGTLEFEKSFSGGQGTMIFKKDNPSGDPVRDDVLEIPILFK